MAARDVDARLMHRRPLSRYIEGKLAKTVRDSDTRAKVMKGFRAALSMSLALVENDSDGGGGAPMPSGARLRSQLCAYLLCISPREPHRRDKIWDALEKLCVSGCVRRLVGAKNVATAYRMTNKPHLRSPRAMPQPYLFPSTSFRVNFQRKTPRASKCGGSRAPRKWSIVSPKSRRKT